MSACFVVTTCWAGLCRGCRLRMYMESSLRVAHHCLIFSVSCRSTDPNLDVDGRVVGIPRGTINGKCENTSIKSNPWILKIFSGVNLVYY